MVEVCELAARCGVGDRHLERLFKKQVGLTPRLYCRIIRCSQIFRAVEEENFSWARFASRSGFTAQSHFIKGFKEFTGEEPCRYLFEDENMANFFLKK